MREIESMTLVAKITKAGNVIVFYIPARKNKGKETLMRKLVQHHYAIVELNIDGSKIRFPSTIHRINISQAYLTIPRKIISRILNKYKIDDYIKINVYLIS